jgi:hypothetical protein
MCEADDNPYTFYLRNLKGKDILEEFGVSRILLKFILVRNWEANLKFD